MKAASLIRVGKSHWFVAGKAGLRWVSSHLCYPNTGGKCHLWMSSTCKVGQCVPVSVVKPGAIPSIAVPQLFSSIKRE